MTVKTYYDTIGNAVDIFVLNGEDISSEVRKLLKGLCYEFKNRIYENHHLSGI